MSPEQGTIPRPRRELIAFALLLPIVMAGAGWLSVRWPGAVLAVLVGYAAAAIIGTISAGRQWRTRAWSLFIPSLLLAFMIMGTATENAARIAGGWAVVGATIGAMVLVAPQGEAIVNFCRDAAEPIAIVVGTVLLFLAYFLVMTPIAFIRRPRPAVQEESYWVRSPR